MLGVVLLLASWLMPSHFPPWVSWHSEAVAFLALLLLAWVCLASRLRAVAARPLQIPMATLGFVALCCIVLIQAAAGLITFWGDALVLLLYFMLCGIAWLLGFAAMGTSGAEAPRSSLANAPALLQSLALVLLFGALASTALALFQVFDLWDNASWIVRMTQLRRPGGNLAQPNQLATLLLMGLASLLYFYESRQLAGGSAALCFAVLALGVAATESRTAVLSFLLLSSWALMGRARSGLRLPPWAVGAAICSFLVLFWTWPAAVAQVHSLAPGAAVDTKAGLRVVAWPQLWDAILLRPWWGWGLREVSAAHNAVADAYAVSSPFTYSHNILLDLMLGLGLPLAALLVLWVVRGLWRRIAAARSLTPWYCLAAVLPVAVHSLLEFPYAYAYFLVPVMLLLGLLDASTGSTKPVMTLGLKSALGTLLCTSLLAAWSVAEYLAIEEDFRVARFEALRIGETPVDYERPKIYVLTQLDALLHGARIKPRPSMAESELELARKVALRFPWPATQNRYALSLALNGHADEAVRQMRVLRAMHEPQAYAQIKLNWEAFGQQYPQIRLLPLP